MPDRRACDRLGAGQVGYLICNIKSLKDVRIGDTVAYAAMKGLKHYPVTSRQSEWFIVGFILAMVRVYRVTRCVRKALDQRPVL